MVVGVFVRSQALDMVSRPRRRHRWDGVAQAHRRLAGGIRDEVAEKIAVTLRRVVLKAILTGLG